MLIKLKDGGLEKLYEDRSNIPGCETCDYYSEYTNDVCFYLTKCKLQLTINNMYNYAMSEGWLMQLLLSNNDKFKEMTEEDFIKFISDAAHADFDKLTEYYGSDYGVVTSIEKL